MERALNVQSVQLSENAPTPEDYATAKMAAEKLNELYPGYLWAVHAQRAQGILQIRNLSLPAQYGYTIHLHPIASVSELTRKAAMAGGEILERYRLRRRKIDFDEYDAVPLDFRGHMIGDVA